jgi:hypothetical protein
LDQCVCRGDGEGLTLEVHLGDPPAVIRLSTRKMHPQLGNGLHGDLKLPIYDEQKSITERCAALNLRETMWTDIPQFGCWWPFALGTDDHACLNFSSFIPNALYGKGNSFTHGSLALPKNSIGCSRGVSDGRLTNRARASHQKKRTGPEIRPMR